MRFKSILRRHERLRKAICRKIQRTVKAESRITGNPQRVFLRRAVPLDHPALTSNRQVIAIGISYQRGLSAEVHNNREDRNYILPLRVIPTDVLIKILAKLS
jgi:hypothetical protein